MGQLCIFASKAKIADLSALQRLSADIANADIGGKAEKIQEFVQEFATIMGDEGVQIPSKLTDKIRRREGSTPEPTPTSTPMEKRRKTEKPPAKIPQGLTVNPFAYIAQSKEKEVRG